MDSTINKWNVRNYYIRDYKGTRQEITKGLLLLDTTLNINSRRIQAQGECS
jgi:hypothetical protein